MGVWGIMTCWLCCLLCSMSDALCVVEVSFLAWCLWYEYTLLMALRCRPVRCSISLLARDLWMSVARLAKLWWCRPAMQATLRCRVRALIVIKLVARNAAQSVFVDLESGWGTGHRRPAQPLYGSARAKRFHAGSMPSIARCCCVRR